MQSQFRKLDRTGDGKLNANDVTDHSEGEILKEEVIGE